MPPRAQASPRPRPPTPSLRHSSPAPIEKRAALQPRVSKEVVIGIALGTIALVACALVAVLVRYLRRDTRRARREAHQVDLLAPQPYVLDRPSADISLEQAEKPLPAVPLGEGRWSVDSGAPSSSAATGSSAHVAMPARALVPSPDSSAPGVRRASSGWSISTQTSGQTRGTVTTATTASEPVTDGTLSMFSLVSPPPPAQTPPRPRLVVANGVASTDSVRTTRGRTAPFPSTRRRPASIVTAPSPQDPRPPAPLSAPAYGAGRSYTVQVPPSPRSQAAVGTPLTLSARGSGAVRDVVVERVLPARSGRGRVVQMSVVLEDDEDRRETMRSEVSLGHFMDGYYHAADLPPYTPPLDAAFEARAEAHERKRSFG